MARFDWIHFYVYGNCPKFFQTLKLSIPPISSAVLPQEFYDAAGWELPHTLASGYGTLNEGDLKKTPVQVLDAHETLVKNWLQTANHYQVEAAVKTAADHQYFHKFRRDFWDQAEEQKFGSSPKEDVLKFDMWLKKIEISENGPKKFNTEPPQPSPATISREEMEVQKDEKNKGAYQDYWKKYERKNGSSNLSTASTTEPSSSPQSATPSPASVASRASPTGITPECKKRLDLGGWGGEL